MKHKTEPGKKNKGTQLLYVYIDICIFIHSILYLQLVIYVTFY